MTDTDFSSVSNFISDCWQYFGDDAESLSNDAAIVYQLLSLADEICSKHID